MWKWIGLAVVVLVAVIGAVAYLNRLEILLRVAGSLGVPDVGPNRPVTWEQGPERSSDLPADRPNIVFILLDDAGINDLSGFGKGLIDTPHIAQLASQGALFTNALAGHANCAPSRAAILTGRDAAHTGFDVTPVPDNMARMVSMISNADRRGRPEWEYDAAADAANPTFFERGLPSSEITLAEILRDAGYRTLHIGKWHLGRTDGMWPHDQG